MSRYSTLADRVADLEAAQMVDAIPSFDENGNRAWIRGRGSGILFYPEIMRLSPGRYPTLAELPANLAELVKLWARAEVDSDRYGGIAVANKEFAQRVMNADQNQV